MSDQNAPVTMEWIRDLFKETDRQLAEIAKKNAADDERRRQEDERRRQEDERRRQDDERRRQDDERRWQAADERRRQDDERRWQAADELRKQDDERRRQDDERRKKEAEASWDELKRLSKETEKKIAALGDRIGEIVEHMIGGDIVNQFRELGYPVKLLSRNILFGEPGTKEYGEVDLFLQNGDTAILIEVKTNLSVDDVKEHVDRMEKFRRFINEGHGDSAIKYYIGALAAAVVKPNIAAFAQKQGFYVIVQSGEAVEILPSPDGFVAKKW